MSQRISIIVPVYNSEQWLERCIQSIVTQTHTEWELLLVDDGSTDSSGDICDRYAATDSRIRVIHQLNGGEMAARATGVRNASNEYILCVDSDDYIAKDCLSSMLVCMDDNTDIVVFEASDTLTLTANQYLCELFKFKNWTVWGKLYRKNIFDEYVISVPRKFKVGGDFLTQLRILSNVDKCIKTFQISKYNYNTNNPNSVQISHKKSYEYERDMVIEVSDILSRFPKNDDVANALFHWKMIYLNGMIGLRYSIDFSDDWIRELVVESKSRKLSAKEFIVIKAINNPLLRIVPIIDKQLHIFARRCIHLIRR